MDQTILAVTKVVHEFTGLLGVDPRALVTNIRIDGLGCLGRVLHATPRRIETAIW